MKYEHVTDEEQADIYRGILAQVEADNIRTMAEFEAAEAYAKKSKAAKNEVEHISSQLKVQLGQQEARHASTKRLLAAVEKRISSKQDVIDEP